MTMVIIFIAYYAKNIKFDYSNFLELYKFKKNNINFKFK